MKTSFALVTWTFIWTIDGMDISRFLRFQKGPSRICKMSPVASVLVAQIFQQNFYGYDRVPHWQHVDGWKQMKSWCSLPWWRDHERGALGFSRRALARENCAVKRLRPLVGAPHVLSAAALWWTIIECSKGEVQPTGFAWHCYKTALNAGLELKCTCWWNTRSHSRQIHKNDKVTVRKIWDLSSCFNHVCQDPILPLFSSYFCSFNLLLFRNCPNVHIGIVELHSLFQNLGLKEESSKCLPFALEKVQAHHHKMQSYSLQTIFLREGRKEGVCVERSCPLFLGRASPQAWFSADNLLQQEIILDYFEP